MVHSIFTITKRTTFIFVRENGFFIRGKNFNIQILHKQDLNNSIGVGYTATKKMGNAVKRNKAKRIMRELSKKVIGKYGKKNSYYVLIAKNSIFEKHFSVLEIELKKMISQ